MLDPAITIKSPAITIIVIIITYRIIFSSSDLFRSRNTSKVITMIPNISIEIGKIYFLAASNRKTPSNFWGVSIKKLSKARTLDHIE